jgi:hypothetical protein
MIVNCYRNAQQERQTQKKQNEGGANQNAFITHANENYIVKGGTALWSYSGSGNLSDE